MELINTRGLAITKHRNLEQVSRICLIYSLIHIPHSAKWRD